MRSVLFVCTANICRSPMAEGVFRKLLQDSGLGADIQGTPWRRMNSSRASRLSRAPARPQKRRGYEIGHLASRKGGPADFDHFDAILAMDKSNLASLRTIAPTRSKQKIEPLTEYSDKYHGKEIADPYGGKPKDYEIALDMIEDSCRGLVEQIKQTTRRQAAPK